MPSLLAPLPSAGVGLLHSFYTVSVSGVGSYAPQATPQPPTTGVQSSYIPRLGGRIRSSRSGQHDPMAIVARNAPLHYDATGTCLERDLIDQCKVKHRVMRTYQGVEV
jgi:hypothetical protein